MSKGPESYVKKDVDEMLKARGCWYDTRTSVGYGQNGVPDRMGIYRGIPFAIECKATDTMKPTAAQQRQLRKIIAAGGYAIVVGAPTHKAKLAEFFGGLDIMLQERADEPMDTAYRMHSDLLREYDE